MEEKKTQLIAEIWELLEPIIRSEGMEIIELEYRSESRGWVLRLFLDQEQGVSVDDCARMSQLVGDVLDAADLIHNPYHLEVSSPGLNRPLRKWKHFRDHLSKIIEARTTTPILERRNFKGTLVAATPEEIKMNCDGRDYDIPLLLLDRARLCYFDSLDE